MLNEIDQATRRLSHPTVVETLSQSIGEKYSKFIHTVEKFSLITKKFTGEVERPQSVFLEGPHWTTISAYSPNVT